MHNAEITMICGVHAGAIFVDTFCNECACRPDDKAPRVWRAWSDKAWLCWLTGLYTCDDAPACTEFLPGVSQ